MEIVDLVTLCYNRALKAGWWDTPEMANIPTKLCLIHSEISEAMEGHRKNLKDSHLPSRPSIEVELADAVIRIADLAGRLELDLEGAILDKLDYNDKREDHKLENRMSQGGKKY